MTILRQTVALLSRMYLVIILTFLACALVPVLFSWTPTIVMSGSMAPNIQPGDILVAQPIAQDKLKSTLRKGQVLLTKDPANDGALLTHRVEKLYDKNDNLTTKGDANRLPDSTPMPLQNILGYERIQVPMIGLPIQSLRVGNYTPIIIFLFTTILAQILVLSESKRQRNLEDDPWDDNAVPRLPRGRRRANVVNQDWKTSATLLFAATITSLLMLVGGSQASLSASTTNGPNTFTVSSQP